MVELIKAPAVPAWPPQNPDKRPRTVRIITTPGGTQRAESLSEIADAEKITFDALINLNFGVRKGDPSGDQWARIINWYLKTKLSAAPMADGNFKFRGGETIYLPTTAAAAPAPGTPDTPLQAAARAEVNDFVKRPGQGKFVDIRRDELGDDLKARISEPTLINQGGIGFCPPASVVHALARSNPLAYARLVMELYEFGKGRLNQLLLEPCQDLLNFKCPREKIRPVDWIPMASLRDSVLWLHNEHDITDFDGTFVPLIVGWLNRAGYTTVEDGSRLLGHASAINLERANDLYKKDYQVLMLVTGSILDGKIRVTPVTTHVVVLNSPIQFGSDAEGNRTVSFTVFTWGKQKQVPSTGTLKMTDFLQNYFGFIACKF